VSQDLVEARGIFGKQPVYIYAQHLGQHKYLGVVDSSQASLDLRKSRPRQIPSRQLTTGGKGILSETTLDSEAADSGTDNVLGSRRHNGGPPRLPTAFPLSAPISEHKVLDLILPWCFDKIGQGNPLLRACLCTEFTAHPAD